jgi:hypothetical protein
VIGRDTALGDPIFLDTADPDLHILTDMHGQGEWCPDPIATNIEAFFATLEELSQAGYPCKHRRRSIRNSHHRDP